MTNEKDKEIKKISIFTDQTNDGVADNSATPLAVDRGSSTDEKEKFELPPFLRSSKTQEPEKEEKATEVTEEKPKSPVKPSLDSISKKLAEIKKKKEESLRTQDLNREDRPKIVLPDSVQAQVNTDKAEQEDITSKDKSVIEEQTAEDYYKQPEYCEEFKFNLPTSALGMVSFFPDSGIAIVNRNGLLYSANIKQEVIDSIPFLSYTTLIALDDAVVLETTNIDGSKSIIVLTEEGEKELNMKAETVIKMIEKAEVDGMFQIKIKKKVYSMFSTAETSESVTGFREFKYEDGSFFYSENEGLLLKEPDNTTVLLADARGCYIGFYLPISEGFGSSLFIGPSTFVNPRRITQTLVGLEEEETGKKYILTCERPLLISLEDLGINDFKDIAIVNGVAFVKQTINGSACLNVFTPKHQRIITEGNVQIDSLSIQNGIYLPTQGVVLLDDGKLLFAREEEEGRVVIKGKAYNLPQEYLEVHA